MNEEKYKELLSKLNNALNTITVSPMGGLGDTNSDTQSLHLSSSMDIEKLSTEELYLSHTLLHNFYATKSKHFTLEELKHLHSKIAKKINHKKFDSLDY